MLYYFILAVILIYPMLEITGNEAFGTTLRPILVIGFFVLFLALIVEAIMGFYEAQGDKTDQVVDNYLGEIEEVKKRRKKFSFFRL